MTTEAPNRRLISEGVIREEPWRVTFRRFDIWPDTTETVYRVEAATVTEIVVTQTWIEGDRRSWGVTVDCPGTMPSPTAALVAEILAEVSDEGYRPDDNVIGSERE